MFEKETGEFWKFAERLLRQRIGTRVISAVVAISALSGLIISWSPTMSWIQKTTLRLLNGKLEDTKSLLVRNISNTFYGNFTAQDAKLFGKQTTEQTSKFSADGCILYVRQTVKNYFVGLNSTKEDSPILDDKYEYEIKIAHIDEISFKSGIVSSRTFVHWSMYGFSPDSYRLYIHIDDWKNIRLKVWQKGVLNDDSSTFEADINISAPSGVYELAKAIDYLKQRCGGPTPIDVYMPDPQG